MFRMIIYFQIMNFDEVVGANPFAVSTLEERLAGAGAIPLGGDVTDDGLTAYCVEITNPNLRAEEIETIFAEVGFVLEGGPHDS